MNGHIPPNLVFLWVRSSDKAGGGDIVRVKWVSTRSFLSFKVRLRHERNRLVSGPTWLHTVRLARLYLLREIFPGFFEGFIVTKKLRNRPMVAWTQSCPIEPAPIE